VAGRGARVRRRRALSRRSAAALWQILDREGKHPDVSTPSPRRHPGIAAHTTRLTAADVTVHLRIPVTSPARTLVDLAHDLDPGRPRPRGPRGAVPPPVRSILAAGSAPAQAIARAPPATPRHRPDAVDPGGPTARHLRSPRHPAARNSAAGRGVPGRLPLAGRARRRRDRWLAGPFDPDRVQADRATSNALQLAGYAVLRFTHADVTRRPAEIARQISDALAGR
jgi:hypothetical protein